MQQGFWYPTDRQAGQRVPRKPAGETKGDAVAKRPVGSGGAGSAREIVYGRTQSESRPAFQLPELYPESPFRLVICVGDGQTEIQVLTLEPIVRP